MDVGQEPTTESHALGLPAGPRTGVIGALHRFASRHRIALTILGSIATVVALVLSLAGKRHEFSHALSSTSFGVLIITSVLQIVALVARSEAWHLSIEAAGGTVARRVLYRASSVQTVGGVLNSQLGVAARIAALRHTSPEMAPQVPTLIAAELPIVAVEAMLAALTSFTLVSPLGIPWWSPILAFLLVASIVAWLRHMGRNPGREFWHGLAVASHATHAYRLVGFVLVAVFAQIFRNWMMLHAVGVDASFFDAIAVLIGLVTLSQLPVGPAVGAAAAVLILGSDGVAASAAAGVLLTVTGTIGGLTFALWGGGDHLWMHLRRQRHAE